MTILNGFFTKKTPSHNLTKQSAENKQNDDGCANRDIIKGDIWEHNFLNLNAKIDFLKD